mmetsp:Transcript_16992/g.25506  ORF Transcript_16992/g.25506 Transcript_16992/m.25506 type:complete len:574 (-) Transcript_16992:77-1798(-)
MKSKGETFGIQLIETMLSPKFLETTFELRSTFCKFPEDLGKTYYRDAIRYKLGVDLGVKNLFQKFIPSLKPVVVGERYPLGPKALEEKTAHQRMDSKMKNDPNVEPRLLHRRDISLVRCRQMNDGVLEEFKHDSILLASKEITESWKLGYSVVIPRIHLHSQLVKTLRRSLFERVPQLQDLASSCNLYATPPGSQGLKPHYDDHCVIIVQIEGVKTWKYSKFPIVYRPRLGAPRKPVDQEVCTERSILLPGDMLYIPRGCPHYAVASDKGASVHVTVTVEIEPHIEWVTALHVAFSEFIRSSRYIGISKVCSKAESSWYQELLRDTEKELLNSVNVDAVSILLHVALDILADKFVELRQPCFLSMSNYEKDRERYETLINRLIPLSSRLKSDHKNSTETNAQKADESETVEAKVLSRRGRKRKREASISASQSSKRTNPIDFTDSKISFPSCIETMGRAHEMCKADEGLMFLSWIQYLTRANDVSKPEIQLVAQNRTVASSSRQQDMENVLANLFIEVRRNDKAFHRAICHYEKILSSFCTALLKQPKCISWETVYHQQRKLRHGLQERRQQL